MDMNDIPNKKLKVDACESECIWQIYDLVKNILISFFPNILRIDITNTDWFKKHSPRNLLRLNNSSFLSSLDTRY